MGLQSHERQTALVMPQEALVAALEAALKSRDEERSMRAKTTAENIDLRDQIDNLMADVKRLTSDVERLGKEAEDARSRAFLRVNLVNERLSTAVQRSKTLKEEKTGLEDGLRAVNARNKRLELVIAGLEAALSHRGADEVVTAIQQAVDTEAENRCTLADLRDPLKFLFRMASRNTHPGAGGDPADFLRVQTAYQQMLRNTGR